jgi:hypothetical protein
VGNICRKAQPLQIPVTTALHVVSNDYVTVHPGFLVKDVKVLHWFTKKYFSVASTKVGELNSICYAEFKFVLSFSLSRKVFKGHTVII